MIILTPTPQGKSPLLRIPHKVKWKRKKHMKKFGRARFEALKTSKRWEERWQKTKTVSELDVNKGGGDSSLSHGSSTARTRSSPICLLNWCLELQFWIKSEEYSVVAPRQDFGYFTLGATTIAWNSFGKKNAPGTWFCSLWIFFQ